MKMGNNHNKGGEEKIALILVALVNGILTGYYKAEDQRIIYKCYNPISKCASHRLMVINSNFETAFY